ncbi:MULTISPECIES: DUF3293 domain-containing protein [unclassified Coleofasciculus]|uniref:DUF3293 domain-containing protein n=1 Tax=unclassified Coleofasciculus TaxID=2692782 RepID=UPI00187F210C|nr:MULTISPECIES: DUF3293 domain-containing protein [unclassified Coleofasciculus]MBE9127293.1 DUF3293 domain-containing protein [Coleofasciculus sp. LEGE 07081]MBE9151546.1 DUF3293 domain-containing protein [Coleofasciculus sp. LEGE 07092]
MSDYNNNSTLDILVKAYTATTYQAIAPKGDILIRIGVHNPDLDLLLNQYGFVSWAFITAWNPASVVLSLSQNQHRHREMIGHLDYTNIPYLEGSGVGDDTDWQPEKSVLALGLNRADAQEIGVLFGQNAVVYGEYKGKPELLWCVV